MLLLDPNTRGMVSDEVGVLRAMALPMARVASSTTNLSMDNAAGSLWGHRDRPTLVFSNLEFKHDIY
jgi:hypothetical protein